MRISQKQSTLASLAYADIFSFPLTLGELKRWLIYYKNPVITTKEIEFKNGFYFLRGRNSLVKIRQNRNREIKVKLKIAEKMAQLLKIIPTIQLVGITGGLSMGNADVKDDIDFFIVTSQRTLWLTRFLSTILMEITGRRRHPGEKEVGNSICLNMFMTQDYLRISKDDRNLFSAHEVLQMLPLWIRGDTYQKFLKTNSWVKNFLPNAWEEKVKSQKSKVKSYKKIPINIFDFFINLSLITCHLSLKFVEPLFKHLQLRYMQRHRTTEVVTDTVIRFHPQDARVWIRKELGRRLKRFNIPLDSVFYSR